MKSDYKSFLDKLQPLVNKAEIEAILTNSNLIERNSIHVVKNSVYENFDRANNHWLEIERISQALDNNETVIVKDLEMWGGKISEFCKYLGHNVTAHMYLSPSHGTAFPFHTDDTDVIIAMQFGTKQFEFQEQDGIRGITLSNTQSFHIPQGVVHRAKTSGWSCHISFGIPKIYIKDSYVSYPIKIPALACIP